MARTLYIDTDENRFVRGPNDDGAVSLTEFFNGDDDDLQIHFLQRTGIPGRTYRFVNKSAASVKAGLGQVRRALTGGTWTITFGANTTTELAYNASASIVETALNALASVTSAGGVTVSKAANYQRYTVTFDDVGSRTAFSVNDESLIPDVTAAISERVEGDVDTREVQVISLDCDPACFQDTFTDLPTSVTATPSTQTAGSSATSEVQKIAFDTAPTEGTFTITVPQDTRSVTAAVVAGVFTTTTNHGFAVGQPVVGTGFTAEANWTEGTTYYVAAVPSPTTFTIAATSGGSAITTATADAGSGTITTPARTTAEINGLASFTDVKTALEALDTIGEGNVSIDGVVGGYYLIQFTGEKANANFPEVTVEDANLVPAYGKTGEFDLATFSLQDIFDATTAESVDLRFEIELTESGKVQTTAATFRATEDIIKSGSSGATLKPSVVADIFRFTEDSTSSAETIEFTKSATNTRCETFVLAVGAGGGTYTTAIEIDTADFVAGDVFRLRLEMPASANPTITVYSGLTAGTLLYTVSGTGAAFTQLFTFTFNGTAWESDQ